MKKFLLFLLLAASVASAQVYPPDSSGAPPFDGGTITSPILGPAANNCSAPPFSFTSDATTGLCSETAGQVNFYLGGTDRWQAAASGIVSNLSGGANSYFSMNQQAVSGGINGLSVTTWGNITTTYASLGLIGSHTNAAYDNSFKATVGKPGSQAFISSYGQNGTRETVEISSTDTTTSGTSEVVFDMLNQRIVSTIPFQAPAGSSSAPAYSFSGDTDLGIYGSGGALWAQARDSSSLSTGQMALSSSVGIWRFLDSSSNAWGISADLDSVDITLEGAVSAIFTTSSYTFNEFIYEQNGGASGPAYSFVNSTNTGAYWNGSAYSIAVQGTQELSVSGTQLATENGGTGSLPAITKISDTNTGVFWPDATGDEIGISAGGYAKWQARHTAKDLTESSATNVVRFTIQNPNGLGATVNWTVIAKDASDQQSRRGSTYIAAVNKAGTVTCTSSDVGTSAFAESAGASTLSVTTSCVTGTNEVFFAINAVSSLTQTTLQARWTAEVDGETSVTHEQ